MRVQCPSCARPAAGGLRLGAAALALALAACSPGLNWRQVRPEAGGVSLLLPCKPDRASRSVPLGGRAVALSMVGCEAEGAMFALSTADIGDAGQAQAVLAQWQTLTLSHIRAGAEPQRLPFKVPGASTEPVRIQSRGQQADGQAVEGQALYFAQGSRLFQAVIYAPRIPAEADDTFFSSIRPE